MGFPEVTVDEWDGNGISWYRRRDGSTFVVSLDENTTYPNGTYLLVPKEQMEKHWVCDYPEFDDPYCQSGMSNPEPEKSRQPSKHSLCGWYVMVPVPKEEA